MAWLYLKEISMTNDEIKELALKNGFKLKEQPDGSIDLSPYVYEFARLLIQENNREVSGRILDLYIHFAKPNHEPFTLGILQGLLLSRTELSLASGGAKLTLQNY